MTDAPGFEIDGTWYPFPTSYRVMDTMLAQQVTGMDWDDIAPMLDGGVGNATVTAVQIAVGVWQGNPGWRMGRVVQYVSTIDFNDIVFPEDTVGDDAGPPTSPVESDITPGSTETSAPSSDETDPSDMTHNSTGSPLSVT